MSLKVSNDWLKKHLAKGYQRGNDKNSGAGKSTNVERHSQSIAKEANQAQNALPPVVIRFTHYRRKLADVDNFATKAFIDQIVTDGLLRDDSPQYVHEVRHRQVKIQTWETEKMVIELIKSEAVDP